MANEMMTEPELYNEITRDNFLRSILAELHLANKLTVAREMYSKSYFALKVADKLTVDKTVVDMFAISLHDWQSLVFELFQAPWEK